MRLTLASLIALSLAACSGRSLDSYLNRGDRYVSTRHYAEAVIEYRNAVRVAPQSAAAWRKLGSVYATIRDFFGAAAAYEHAWGFDRSDPSAALQASAARLELGDNDMAAALAGDVLADHPSNVEAHVLLARALGRSGDSVRAEQQLKKAMKLAPDSARPYEALGELQRRLGDGKAAEKAWRKATELAPRAPAPRVALAGLFVESGRVADGERELRTALDNTPDDPDANREYASLLVSTDRCEDAEPYWQKVADSSPDDTGVLSLADYYVYSGRLDDALRVLVPLTTGVDEGAAARLRVASIYYDRGNPVSAERMIDQVLSRQTDNATALLLKARLLLDRGDRRTASEYSDRASSLAPDDPDLSRRLLGDKSPRK